MPLVLCDLCEELRIIFQQNIANSIGNMPSGVFLMLHILLIFSGLIESTNELFIESCGMRSR